MWKKLLIGAVVLAAVILTVSKVTAKKEPLKTQPVVRKDLEVTIDVSGKVKPDRFASLSFSMLAQITKIASAGAVFKEGETLATLKTDDLYPAVLAAYANLNKATSTFYYYLEVNGETEKTYLGSDDISRAKRNEARINAEAAAAGVDAARFALAQAQAAYGKSVLKAPFEGVVGRVYFRAGENASPSVPVIDFFDPGSFYFEVEADEIDVNSLKAGLPVRMKLDAYGEKQFNGEIVNIDPGWHTTNSGGTAYFVRISFKDEPGSVTGAHLRSGLNGEAKILKETKQGILILPSAAVSNANGKSYVEVLIDGKTKQKQEVTLGELAENEYEALSGVNEGDQVVIP
ncbi:MAG: efflux RND transporter periplasmic adaptor subunit [Patescibacteria group bacterium]